MNTNDVRSLGALRGREFADQQSDEIHNLWSDESVASLHDALADGDYDSVYASLGAPAPLSGEWAGESIPELFNGETLMTLDQFDEYEEEWFSAWSNRLESRVADIHRGRVLTSVRELNAFQLARLADCASPDSLESPGARFLTLVRDSVVERVEYDDVDDPTGAGIVHEIADVCVPVYTHELWSTFVDLAAYQEDPSDLTGEAQQGDMTQAAMTCLYMIGERLALALFEDLGSDV